MKDEKQDSDRFVKSKQPFDFDQEFDEDRIERFVKCLARTYGISRKDILVFLDEKRAKDFPAKGSQSFVAFGVIDEIFDEMMAKILTVLESWGIIPCASEVQGIAKKKLLKDIVRLTQARIKNELPLLKNS